MIQCSNVNKTFGNTQALNNVSFSVPQGAICALLGPNGAGKSTLVHVLTGILKPDSGIVQVCSHSPYDSKIKHLVGVLPETLGLFDLLTVEEHLDLTAAIYGIPKSEARLRTNTLLRMLRLEDGRKTFASHCSYGMKKKTAFAAALLPGPEVLLLDEPFESIDPVTAETIRLQLRAIAARGVTVLLTSHILSLVDRIAERVIMMKAGQIVLDQAMPVTSGSLDDLYFDLIEQPAPEQLQWLGLNQS